MGKENRNYKDTMFRLVFKDKANLLSLYNALNGTNYDNPDELEITTLENAVYMNMKNDVSFALGNMRCMWSGCVLTAKRCPWKERWSAPSRSVSVRGLWIA